MEYSPAYMEYLKEQKLPKNKRTVRKTIIITVDYAASDVPSDEDIIGCILNEIENTDLLVEDHKSVVVEVEN